MRAMRVTGSDLVQAADWRQKPQFDVVLRVSSAVLLMLSWPQYPNSPGTASALQVAHQPAFLLSRPTLFSC